MVKNIIFVDFTDYLLPKVLCKPSNPEYDSFWLPLHMVRALFKVEKIYPGGREEFERDRNAFPDAQDIEPIS